MNAVWLRRALSFLVCGSWFWAGFLAFGQEEPRSLESIYPGAAELRKAASDVVCLVDVEHPDEVRAKLRERAPRFHSLERVRLCIELETAGLPCLLVHASMLRPEDLARPTVKAVVVCGRNRPLAGEEESRLRTLLRGCPAPLLCQGGGLGVLVAAWGGKTGMMRRLQPGEQDPDPSYLPGVYKETGFTRVDIAVQDPIFEGFDRGVEVRQHHGSEVKSVPADFQVLASTEACRVQAIRHRERPVYGLQFLPDRFDEVRTDGRRILRNFFTVAGIDVAGGLEKTRSAFRAETRRLVRDVCQESKAMLEQTKPFVAIVDMEAPEVVASPRKGSGSGKTHAEKIAQLRGRIEGELAGLPSVVVHHSEVLKEDFANPDLRAIVLTGAGSPTADPMKRDLFAVIREARVPIIGLCAGHQHIAEAYGVEASSMRPLREGEKDPHPPYHPGMFKEWGFLPVTVTAKDPLFAGLGPSIVVQEYHVAEVETLPDGFDLLACTVDCEVQAMKQRGKPVYGTQFHPECYDDEHPDGRRVLQNFFRIAAQEAR